MAFINKKISKEEITGGNTSGGGNKYITESGIYDVTIKAVSVEKSKSGATSLNFNLDYNGEGTTIYGMYILNKDGDFLPGFKTFTQLATVAGLVDEDGNMNVEDPEAQVHTLGKDNKEVELQVLDQFTDLNVKLRIQMEYSIYNNQIQERKVIKSFFNEDGAFADEILSGKNVGKRLAFEEEKLANNITYRDELTPEDVAAWKEAKKTGKSAPAVATTAKVAPTAKSNGLFKN